MTLLHFHPPQHQQPANTYITTAFLFHHSYVLITKSQTYNQQQLSSSWFTPIPRHRNTPRPTYLTRTPTLTPSSPLPFTIIAAKTGKKSRKSPKPQDFSSSFSPDDNNDNNNDNTTTTTNNNNSNNNRMDIKQQALLIQQLTDSGVPGSSGSESGPTVKPVVRTKFRRKKITHQTASSLLFNTSMENPIRTTVLPNGKYAPGPKPYLLIDGYNVIGFWKKLKRKREQGNMAGARSALVDAVANFGHIKGWHCCVVFDAMNNKGSSKLRMENLVKGVDVVFTGEYTADHYIEAKTLELCRQNKRQVWAATSDTLQRTLAGAHGAHVMSSTLFIEELKRTIMDGTEKYLINRKNTNDPSLDPVHDFQTKMLIDSVDSNTKNALMQLRQQMNGSA